MTNQATTTAHASTATGTTSIAARAPETAEEVGATRAIPSDLTACNALELESLIASCDDHLEDLKREADAARTEREAYIDCLRSLRAA